MPVILGRKSLYKGGELAAGGGRCDLAFIHLAEVSTAAKMASLSQQREPTATWMGRNTGGFVLCGAHTVGGKVPARGKGEERHAQSSRGFSEGGQTSFGIAMESHTYHPHTWTLGLSAWAPPLVASLLKASKKWWHVGRKEGEAALGGHKEDKAGWDKAAALQQQEHRTVSLQMPRSYFWSRSICPAVTGLVC